MKQSILRAIIWSTDTKVSTTDGGNLTLLIRESRIKSALEKGKALYIPHVYSIGFSGVADSTLRIVTESVFRAHTNVPKV